MLVENTTKALYANGISVAINVAEAALFFSLDTPRIGYDGMAKEVGREIVADIRIPPVLAKQLMLSLKESLDFYEGKFGEIQISAEKTQDVQHE